MSHIASVVPPQRRLVSKHKHRHKRMSDHAIHCSAGESLVLSFGVYVSFVGQSYVPSAGQFTTRDPHRLDVAHRSNPSEAPAYGTGRNIDVMSRDQPAAQCTDGRAGRDIARPMMRPVDARHTYQRR